MWAPPASSTSSAATRAAKIPATEKPPANGFSSRYAPCEFTGGSTQLRPSITSASKPQQNCSPRSRTSRRGPAGSAAAASGPGGEPNCARGSSQGNSPPGAVHPPAGGPPGAGRRAELRRGKLRGELPAGVVPRRRGGAAAIGRSDAEIAPREPAAGAVDRQDAADRLAAGQHGGDHALGAPERRRSRGIANLAAAAQLHDELTGVRRDDPGGRRPGAAAPAQAAEPQRMQIGHTLLADRLVVLGEEAGADRLVQAQRLADVLRRQGQRRAL